MYSWQFYWPHWWKLWPVYQVTWDYEYNPPLGGWVFAFGPFQAMGYTN